MLRKSLLLLLVLLVLAGFRIFMLGHDVTDLNSLPPLESGDLIFETALSDQSTAIMLATFSPYTHVGIVHKTSNGISVIHASSSVMEVPLSEFITYGWGQKITIKRYEGLNELQQEALVRDAQNVIGTPYNYEFYMKSPTLYCSELPYLTYKHENITLGTLQKIGDLNVNNPPVKAIFERRWKSHPLCQKDGMTYDQCWSAVMDEPIITPVSIAHDPHLQTIFSNYRF